MKKELEGREVGLVDYAEAEGIGVEAFVSFNFDILAFEALLAKKSSPSIQQK